jgi:hypothetical protein
MLQILSWYGTWCDSASDSMIGMMGTGKSRDHKHGKNSNVWSVRIDQSMYN